MIAKVFNPIDQRWRETLGRLRHDVYHTPEYFLLEASRTGCTAEAIVLQDGERLFFLPYLVCGTSGTARTTDQPTLDIISPYGYPGPLVTDDEPEFLNHAMTEIRSHFLERGACSAFLRCHPIIGPAFTDVQVDGLSVSSSETVFVDLSLSESQIWTTTRKGHQSAINKCIRLGQSCDFVPFDECRDDFLEIYRQTMEHAAAGQSYYFDQTYFDTLASATGVSVAVVELDSRIIACCLIFEYGGIVQAHLGGTLSGFRSMSPFSLLLHATRGWAKSRGNKVLHLGGGVGGHRDSVFSFKAGFSRRRSEFTSIRMLIDPDRYSALVTSRAAELHVDRELLLATGYFPAYRSTLDMVATTAAQALPER